MINWWPLTRSEQIHYFLKLIAGGEKNHEAVIQLILGLINSWSIVGIVLNSLFLGLWIPVIWCWFFVCVSYLLNLWLWDIVVGIQFMVLELEGPQRRKWTQEGQ